MKSSNHRPQALLGPLFALAPARGALLADSAAFCRTVFLFKVEWACVGMGVRQGQVLGVQTVLTQEDEKPAAGCGFVGNDVIKEFRVV